MQQNQRFHPVTACNEGLFNTKSGKVINLLHPTEEMIDIRDIAGALSKICRFGGHTSQFYSVAQHCVLVAAMAPENIKKEALLHDAAEAYLGDVIKPLKVKLGGLYRSFEVVFETVIAQKYLLYTDGWTHDQIKTLDLKALELEHLAFQQGNTGPFLEALNQHQLAMNSLSWPPEVAEAIFLTAFASYFDEPQMLMPCPTL